MQLDLTKVRKRNIEILYFYRHKDYPIIYVESGTGKLYLYDTAYYVQTDISRDRILELGYIVEYPSTENISTKIL